MPVSLPLTRTTRRRLSALLLSLFTPLFAADFDQDGLDDALEVSTYFTNPADPDSDLDHLTDGAEVLLHLTDPLLADSDGDNALDDWEVADIPEKPYRSLAPVITLTRKPAKPVTKRKTITPAKAPARNAKATVTKLKP